MTVEVEGSGESLVTIRSQSSRSRCAPAARSYRFLRTQGTSGTRLLVRALPSPPNDFRRHDPGTGKTSDGSRSCQSAKITCYRNRRAHCGLKPGLRPTLQQRAEKLSASVGTETLL